MFAEPQQTLSGINFNINSSYARNWHYKSEVCSCTTIGRHFYMLYINQGYLEHQQNLLSGVIQLLVSLNSLGLLDFGPFLNHHPDLVEQFIVSNLGNIIQLSEISFAFDYNECDISIYVPERSKLETTLARHQCLWVLYDKRIYCSSSYKNYRDNYQLLDHPIRLEFHLNLHYGARYLHLGLLNNSIQGIFDIFQPYIWKSWKRHCLQNYMPSLPYSYIHAGRVSHSSLKPLKTA